LPCNCFVGSWLQQPFKVLQSIWFWFSMIMKLSSIF
jgi:hypothetical protein